MKPKLLPDGTVLFKYTSAETAIKILKSRQIRLAKHSNLNDPFEGRSFRYVDANDRLKEAFLEKMISFLYGEINEKHPNMFSDGPLALVRDHMRNNPKLLISKKELSQLLSSEIERHIQRLKTDSPKMTKAITDSVFDKWVVFSTSLTPNDVLMLTHYANNHRGVVLGFKCLHHLDTALSASLPINYVSDAPTLYTHTQYLKSIFGEEEVPLRDHMNKIIFSKHKRWEYEKEMRLTFPADDISDEGYLFIDINPTEVHSIYWGCQIRPEAKEEILKILDEKYSHTKRYDLIRDHEKNQFKIFPTTSFAKKAHR